MKISSWGVILVVLLAGVSGMCIATATRNEAIGYTVLFGLLMLFASIYQVGKAVVASLRQDPSNKKEIDSTKGGLTAFVVYHCIVRGGGQVFQSAQCVVRANDADLLDAQIEDQRREISKKVQWSVIVHHVMLLPQDK